MSIKSISVLEWVLLLLASLFLWFIMYALAQVLLEAFSRVWLCCIVAVGVAAGMTALYALFVKLFERHPAEDIPASRIAPDTLKGLGLGFGFFIIVVGIMCAAGLYHFEAFRTDADSLAANLVSFFAFLVVGVAEEIIFRGILFRWIDEKWGFVAALIVSSIIFGLLHIFQPEATLWSSFAIAVEAGLLLGAAYKYSGTLWLPIGIHWAWNFTQGNIFGFAVSGSDAGDALIQASVSGPDILTGGAFGAEASVISLLVGLALSLWFILRKRASA